MSLLPRITRRRINISMATGAILALLFIGWLNGRDDRSVNGFDVLPQYLENLVALVSVSGTPRDVVSPDRAAEPSAAASVDQDRPTRASPDQEPIDLQSVSRVNTGQHPLTGAIRWAQHELQQLRRIDDYSCFLTKRERIDGVLRPQERIFVKVRHRPFSVYLKFLSPADVRGQECLYVEGQNNGKLLARPGGVKGTLVGTIALKPTSRLGMTGTNYPITDVGIVRLLERVLMVSERDAGFDDCQVTALPAAEFNGKLCPGLQVVHQHPRKEFMFHIARVYVDPVLIVPVHYSANDWPKTAHDEPALLESFTYDGFKLNNGFTDDDFSPNNPNYSFARQRPND